MRKRTLTINISFQAQNELRDIWQYNTQRHGAIRADRYDDFLRSGIDKLTSSHTFGKIVEVMPELRYVTAL